MNKNTNSDSTDRISGQELKAVNTDPIKNQFKDGDKMTKGETACSGSGCGTKAQASKANMMK